MTYQQQGPRAALSHRDFRLIWLGAFVSSIGTWMQNVIVSEWAYSLTGSTAFIGLISGALLGPSLLLPLLGGALADRMDRRRLLIALQGFQGAACLGLAQVARQSDPSRTAILVLILGVGLGQAMSGPVIQSLVPNLVPQRDLAGAISLQSTQMNLSRVVGPMLAATLRPLVNISGIFTINAFTYIAIIAAVAVVTIPDRSTSSSRSLLEGVRVARQDSVIGRILITMTIFSFFCLNFITLMPAVARKQLGMRTDGTQYLLLFAVFGIGAAFGSIGASSFLAKADRLKVARAALFGFTLSLGGLCLSRSAVAGFIVLPLIGFFYFTLVTNLVTRLQQRAVDSTRGRVMALWQMAFAGTVPLGAIVFGYAAQQSSPTVVLVMGTLSAGLLTSVWPLGRTTTG